MKANSDTQGTLKKVAVSSFLGNFIEWFDYATYSYFAIVIANVFFPNDDPALALMQTFAVFALSFLLRPIGAIFWGSMGDKKGRKWALSTSIFLMTGATFCIGLLPGYLTIGLAAPIMLLLLRMVQGFSASGEYAGAATFLAEYAPKDKRGVYCSLVPASTAVGLLVGSTFATVMYSVLPSEAVNDWGWRIPFLLAGPLGLIAHYIRTKLEDSPTYQEMQKAIDKADDSNHPIRDLFRHHSKELVISFGACVLNAVGFYVVLTYLPVYLETAVGMDPSQSSLITTISLIVYVAFIFGSGHLSDKFGRKKMLIIACVSFIVLTVPAFMLLNTADFFIVLVVELVLCLALTINDGTLSSYLTETFPTAVRYTGFALSFNMANAIFGGSASFISTALIAATGSNLAPAWYMVGVSCLALVAMILSHEHTGKDLADV
ncbi:MFS transporter [Paraeggerthella hongkongensis]|uniref:Putative proline/betaine transporter n=1 Tax=Paraeggerthella hongkongensis TaxID=230658 RepID=A0A3N0AZ88_9ACTN|nr:MFS transporter [Paraeggerthella hongkongensis]RNL39869.1 MFS transporter [Paraeggerthella hongkongensis]